MEDPHFSQGTIVTPCTFEYYSRNFYKYLPKVGT